MHGNVSEWVWDYYGEYDINEQHNPTGALNGNLRVYRGGGWNDFGKNTRSAYRGTMAQNMASFNVGMRLVRNAFKVDSIVSSQDTRGEAFKDGKILIVFFSWGGNTRGIAHHIQRKTGADLFEIELVVHILITTTQHLMRRSATKTFKQDQKSQTKLKTLMIIILF